MADSSYTTKVYNKQGGDEQVIASGGQQTVESGGEIEVESGGTFQVEAGGKVEVDGEDVTDELKALSGVTATAAEINRLAGVTPGTVTASKAVVVDADKKANGIVLVGVKIDDGDAGVTIASADQTHATPTATIPDLGDAADEFVMKDVVQTLTNKELTAPGITHAIEAGITLAAGDVTLSAAQKIKAILEVTTGHAANAIIAPAEQRTYIVVNNDAANNVLIKKAAGTPVTIPPSTSAVVYYNGTEYIMVACNEVTLGGTQTLTSKTLTTPKIAQYAISHNYGGAAADWTLSAAELKAQILVATNANGAVNAVLNTGTPNYYLVYNNTGFVLTCKNAAGTTIAIPNGKRAFVYNDGTNIVSLDSFVSPLLVTPKIDDGDAGLTVTSANQTHAAPTATIPDLVGAADEFVMKGTEQTLTQKRMTSPKINEDVALAATATQMNSLIRYPGAMAMAVVDFNNTGEAAMKITIDGVDYQEADLADAPNGVWTNGASAADSATSFAAAVNGDTRAAVPFTAIVNAGGGSVILMAKAAGVAGNVVITTTSAGNCTVENATGGAAAGIKQMVIVDRVVTAQDVLAEEVNIPLPFTPTKILVNYFDANGVLLGTITDKASIQAAPARVRVLKDGATNLAATNVVQVLAIE
jgi:hypothetical protein